MDAHKTPCITQISKTPDTRPLMMPLDNPTIPELQRRGLLPSLKRHASLYVSSAVCCGLLGLGISFAIPNEWTASLLLQVGQVATTGAPTLLADPANVIQRISFPSFVLEVLHAANLPAESETDKRVGLIKKTLSARAARGGSLVEVSVRDYSPDDAKNVLTTTVRVLQQEHAKLLLPSETRLKKNLEEVKAALARLEHERESLLTPLENARTANSIEKKFSESVMLANLIEQNGGEERKLQERKIQIEEELSPFRTFNTQAVTSAYVPPQPTFPRKTLFLFTGGLFGLALAVLWSIFRDRELRKAIVDIFSDDESAADRERR